MNAYKERNEAIVAAYLAGTETYRSLAGMHGVSSVRIQQIIERQRRRDLRSGSIGLVERWASTDWGKRHLALFAR